VTHRGYSRPCARDSWIREVVVCDVWKEDRVACEICISTAESYNMRSFLHTMLLSVSSSVLLHHPLIQGRCVLSIHSCDNHDRRCPWRHPVYATTPTSYPS